MPDCAEVEPSQKEQIVVALKQAGNVVGYLGDGINDAAAGRIHLAIDPKIDDPGEGSAPL